MRLLIIAVCITLFVTAAHAGDIADMAVKWVGEDEAAVVEAVCWQVGEEENIDPWLIACVWRYEAGFKKDPPGYYIGGLQLAPSHLKHFEEYGFDNTYWKDWIRYGVHLWRLSDDNGKTLLEALQPWKGVRAKAIKLYKSIRGTADGWNKFPVPDSESEDESGE